MCILNYIYISIRVIIICICSFSFCPFAFAFVFLVQEEEEGGVKREALKKCLVFFSYMLMLLYYDYMHIKYYIFIMRMLNFF